MGNKRFTAEDAKESEFYDKKDWCGCCGRLISSGRFRLWCNDCLEHLGSSQTPWDRTYFAQHNTDCPFAAYPLNNLNTFQSELQTGIAKVLQSIASPTIGHYQIGDILPDGYEVVAMERTERGWLYTLKAPKSISVSIKVEL